MNDPIPEDDPHYPYYEEKPEDETDEPRGELLPCPFCRVSLRYVPHNEWYEHPDTGDCILDRHTVYADTPEDIAQWETRAEHARVVGIIERRVAELEENLAKMTVFTVDEVAANAEGAVTALKELLAEVRGNA